MEATKVMPAVETWDLSTYPDKDPRDEKPASDVFRLAYLTPNGDIAYKLQRWTQRNQETGMMEEKTQNGQPRRFDIKGGGGVEKMIRGSLKIVNHQTMVSKPSPQDIRNAERAIEGKPTMVRMGLWHQPQFNDSGEIYDWKPVDRKKVLQPPYWKDVTEAYYKEWRQDAYDGKSDPYKGQHRPYTRIQELEKAAGEQKASLEAEVNKLRAELAKKEK